MENRILLNALVLFLGMIIILVVLICTTKLHEKMHYRASRLLTFATKKHLIFFKARKLTIKESKNLIQIGIPKEHEEKIKKLSTWMRGYYVTSSDFTEVSKLKIRLIATMGYFTQTIIGNILAIIILIVCNRLFVIDFKYPEEKFLIHIFKVMLIVIGNTHILVLIKYFIKNLFKKVEETNDYAIIVNVDYYINSLDKQEYDYYFKIYEELKKIKDKE